MMMWRLLNPVFYKFCKFSYKLMFPKRPPNDGWMDQEAETHCSCEVTRSRLFDLLQVLVAYAANWDTLLAKRPLLICKPFGTEQRDSGLPRFLFQGFLKGRTDHEFWKLVRVELC
jgi:hypothetical protein